jgi:hypothetical protein
MVGVLNEINGFECCFCKQSIEENKVDPVDINIVLNEDMQLKTGSFQNFYCHFDCLKKRLHKDIQGYLVRDDE